ncbi:MAG TPA: membrane protein insertion efficiency factor YidD, partial [Anaeromyxobacteraceae bacterium]|nr:membrane protein insertion efficiency factor YidD [Anaeromyxobacteraceae bacterium]
MSPPARALRWLVHLYQRWLSPFIRPECRFYPSCSAYAAG